MSTKNWNGRRCGRRGLFGTNWVSILASLLFLTASFPPRPSSCCCVSANREEFSVTQSLFVFEKRKLCYANKKYWIIENGIKNLEQKPLDKANGKKFGFYGQSTVHCWNNQEGKEERKARKRLVTTFHSLGNRVVCKRVRKAKFSLET